MSLNETRWMLDHFEADPLEKESIRITLEILKTAAVVVFGIAVIWIL